MSGSAAPRALSRAAVARGAAPPVRLVHLGLGGFFRAHQAWYTDRAPDAAEWGIAAFTGRRPAAADVLAAQDGLYTLVTRHPHGDTHEVVGSLAAVHPAADHAAWLAALASPSVAVVTLTVTEAGYCTAAGGGLDRASAAVRADVDALRHDHAAPVRTVPGRLVAGLLARRRAEAPPLALVPCDNLPANGPHLAAVLRDLAVDIDAELAGWCEAHVSVVTTVVDRITPRTTDDLVAEVAATTGWGDRAPVVTEPFSEWVLAGAFPAGRPAWEASGARFVPDAAPFAQRKLWLLNGAHSLLAYLGIALGHETVAGAIADEACRGWVERWWSEAGPHLPQSTAEVADYTDALLERFANPRLRHPLAQIAQDGSVKLPVRILPVLRAFRESGDLPEAATCALGAWLAHLRAGGPAVSDVRVDELSARCGGEPRHAAASVLELLDPDLGGDVELVAAVGAVTSALEAGALP